MELVADILAEAMSGANKTRIMYRANLNLSRFDVYLSELLKNGLLTREKNGNGPIVYRTTAAGVSLLETLRKAEELMGL